MAKPNVMEVMNQYATIVGWVLKHESALMESLSAAAGKSPKASAALSGIPSVEIAQVSAAIRKSQENPPNG